MHALVWLSFMNGVKCRLAYSRVCMVRDAFRINMRACYVNFMVRGDFYINTYFIFYI